MAIGITDTNKLRVEATHDWIRKCQALWYVAAVDRICTDENLESTISDYAERFRDMLAIVVTKIDVGISDGLAADMQAKGQSVGEYWQIKNVLTCLQAELELNRRRRKTANMEQKLKLYGEEDEINGQIERERSRGRGLVMDARNDYIARRLVTEKSKYMPDGAKLRIICVSNFLYTELKTSQSDSQQIGDINDTGIPELRSYALLLASPGVWETYEEHLLFKVRVFFSGIHNWAEGCPVKRHAGLIDTVRKTSDLWHGLIEMSLPKMHEVFELGIVQSLRNAHGDSLRGVMEWYNTVMGESWWPNSFLAFFRNDGKHRTCAIGSESWNKHFIEQQTKDVINPEWNAKIPPPEEFLSAPVNKLIAAIQDLPAQLNRLPGSVPLPNGAFEGILSGYNYGITAAHARRQADYKQSLANIRLDATLDQYTGHFTQAMQPCYDKGKEDRGKGVCKRLSKLLLDHLTIKDPLGQATDKLSAALQNTADQHAWALRCDVDRILSDIVREFEAVLQRESETDLEKRARESIRSFLAGAMPRVNRIEGNLARIKQRYQGL